MDINPDRPDRLIRAIGRWSLTALVVNSVIGSGVFGLPSTIALHVGPASPYAVLIAGIGMGMIMACFAEVASQFKEAGGPYLYARAAFGRFAGLQVGWITWLVRITAASANANLFVDYLAEFLPSVSQPAPRMVVLTLMIGTLTAINFRGVRAGTRTSNVFTLAKLLPLAAFVIIGLLVLGVELPRETVPRETDWPKALLLLAFAYGGFDSALIPIGEVKNPRKDAPFALLSALAIVTATYTLVQLLVMSALESPESSSRPLADAARGFLGGTGAAIISAGALISVFGYLSASMLNVPRLTFALAESRDFPSFFGRVHSRFRTPHVSILAYGALLWIVAVAGSFEWNASLSAVARLFTYSIVCAAVIRLRSIRPRDDAFRLRFGGAFAVFGILFALFLLAGISQNELVIIVVTMCIAFVNWIVARKREKAGIHQEGVS